MKIRLVGAELFHATRYSCPILMKLELSRQIFEKYSNVIFLENPFSGCRVVSCGRTDGQAEKVQTRQTSSSFSQFCERAFKW